MLTIAASAHSLAAARSMHSAGDMGGLKAATLGAMFATVCASSSARAQDNAQPPLSPSSSSSPCASASQSEDRVCLKDGTLLQGSLVDVTPGVGVLVQVADGSIVHADWSNVLRIRYALDSSLRGPFGPHPPAPPAPPGVLVHLDGSPEAVLEIDTTGNNDWEDLCDSPCDRVVPTGSWYRVGGKGLTHSYAFTLKAPEGGRERIDVHGGSKPWFIVGAIALGVGAVPAAVGVAILYGYFLTLGYAGVSLAELGLALAGAGGALAVPGAIVVALHHKSGVTQSVDSSPTAAPQALHRAPTWVGASADQAYLPTAYGVPLVSMTF